MDERGEVRHSLGNSHRLCGCSMNRLRCSKVFLLECGFDAVVDAVVIPLFRLEVVSWFHLAKVFEKASHIREVDAVTSRVVAEGYSSVE